MLYPLGTNNIGFKIDAHLVLDVSGEDHDLVTLEVVKDIKDNKIIQDGEKLSRQVKNGLDNLIEMLSTSYDDQVFTWSFQASGAECHISTCHMSRSGLYVSVRQHSFFLPATAAT